MLSLARKRLHTALETIANCKDEKHPEGCVCQTALKLYGSQVFKCKWKFCHFHQDGFSGAVLRDEHEISHQRPFICPEVGCSFASLGFKSSGDLARHSISIHFIENSVKDQDISQIQNNLRQLPVNEILIMLEHAVINNDVALSSAAIKALTGQNVRIDFEPILQMAAWKGSADMINMLASEIRSTNVGEGNSNILTYFLENALLVAVGLGNVLTAEALLSNGINPNEGGLIHEDALQRYFRPLKLLTQIPIRILNAGKQHSILDIALNDMNPDMIELLIKDFTAEMTQEALKNIISYTHQNEAGFNDKLRPLRRLMSADCYSYGVLAAVHFCHSTALDICLESGGNPDFFYPPHTYGALYKIIVFVTHYSRHTEINNTFHSHMGHIELLLRRGASPYPTNSQKSDEIITTLEGMRYVEAYFGMGWDELVRKTQAGDDLPVLKVDVKTLAKLLKHRRQEKKRHEGILE